MTDVVITAAKRTPVGAFLGAFAGTPAHELGRVAIEAALAQSGVAAEDVSEVILGQVLTAGQGQNPARQAHINAGLPQASAVATGERRAIDQGHVGMVVGSKALKNLWEPLDAWLSRNNVG